MRIKGRDRKYSLRTIIDTGSQNSFISRYAAKALRNHELKAEETMNYFIHELFIPSNKTKMADTTD